MRSTIICVDDDKWILSVLAGLLSEWLGENYAVEKALSGSEALEIINSCEEEGLPVSLVISDYIMPVMKGDELLEQIKLKSPMTRRIMLTGYAALDGITNAINKAGIYRFIAKPWDNKDMMLTVLQAIHSYEQDIRAERLAVSHKEMYHKFHNLYISLRANMKHMVSALATSVEMREGGGGHAKRVALYSMRIAGDLKLSEDESAALETAAMLHDVGKLGLEDREIEEMRGEGCYLRMDLALRQSEKAKAILASVDEKVSKGVLYHMERIDGKGPHGLKAEAIPIAARIIGLCNYYDILSSSRHGDTPAAILRGMAQHSGVMFDQALFDTLVKITCVD